MNRLPRLLPRLLTRPFSSSQAPPKEPPLPPPSNPNPSPFARLSLSEPLPGHPAHITPSTAPAPASSSSPAPSTTVTVLSNGLRVATEPNLGQFCTVGAIVRSGSRYEVAYPSGVSHFLEKLAFGPTQKFENREVIANMLQEHGGICDCQSTRDTFLYAASVENSGLEATVDLLGEVVLRPKFTDEELEFARMAILYENEDIGMRPDQETLLTEAIHAAAFSNNTLGLPKYAPVDSAKKIDKETLLNYLSLYHTPDRMVLAGVGVDHDRLVKAAQEHFVDAKPVWTSGSSAARRDQSIAQYTGGKVLIEKDLSNASLGPTPMPDLAHLSVGLESVSHQHDDFIAFCVLNMLMGGGGSFSAGGPGKGMYTRLYTNVLNQHHWMYAAQAFNHCYDDTGLFCINSSAPPQLLGELVNVIVSELARLTAHIGKEEFERAKKQLTSMLLMNLESRPVIFEDVARQVLAQGKRRRPEHYIDLIKGITEKDVNRISEKMLASKPAIAAIGNLAKLPEYKDVELGLLDRSPKAKSKMNFFNKS